MIIIDPYETVPLSDFLPELQLEIPELPDDILMNYVRNASIEFASRTGVLKREVTIDLQPCVENYRIETVDCMVVNRITGVCLCGHEVTRVPSGRCAPVSCGCGMVTWWEEPDMIFFSPAPSTPTSVTVFMSVIPADDACEIDAILLRKHKQAVINGTKAQLYSMMRRPWTDIKMAAVAGEAFERSIRKANVQRVLGGQNGVFRNGFRTGFNR